MADIFLSYSRKDLRRIQFLIDVLKSQGWAVWWDAHIVPGHAFAEVIEKELTRAKCVVVVWSKNSVKSNWVRNEARFGKEREALVPVVIDYAARIPAEFKNIEAAMFKRWSDDSTNLEQVNFIKAVRALTSRRRRSLAFSESRTNYDQSVFLNCPFDENYRPLFEALAFTTLSCGFQPRTTIEDPSNGGNRLERIFKLIGACKYGIHDLSRTELAPGRLPRFNIPLELGFFLAAQRFDPLKVRQMRSLIIDKERYRYLRFVSDLAHSMS
jgi:hypothetical protein